MENVNSREAKQILALYRPGTSDAGEPYFAGALELARRDSELKRWLENHCTDYLALRTKLKQISVPHDLRDRIIAKSGALGQSRPADRANIWWRQPSFLATAAVIVFLLSLIALWPGPQPDKSFAAYRARMIQSLARSYPRMDLQTTSLAQIREFLVKSNALADYVLPEPLEKLPGDGCAILSWQGKKVSMICFDAGATNALYLFVIQRSSLKNAPPPGPAEIATVKKLITASWSNGDKTYVLAGRGDGQFIRKYF